MEEAFAWPDQIRAAISLTYDDGLPVHCTLVDPLLRGNGLLATFYPMIQSDRRLAAAGHELGNHTLFHPCRQASPNPYPWLDNRYDLRAYTLAHIRSELEVANLVLHLLDGLAERSYGSTCAQMSIGQGATEEPLEPLLADLFVAARGNLTGQAAQPGRDFNLFNIGCISGDGHSLEELKQVAGRTCDSCGWAILIFHGIGAGTHDLYLDADVHERFIGWLARQQTIWTAPVRTIAHYVMQHMQATTRSTSRPVG